jgi:hypothetical protein
MIFVHQFHVFIPPPEKGSSHINTLTAKGAGPLWFLGEQKLFNFSRKSHLISSIFFSHLVHSTVIRFALATNCRGLDFSNNQFIAMLCSTQTFQAFT